MWCFGYFLTSEKNHWTEYALCRYRGFVVPVELSSEPEKETLWLMVEHQYSSRPVSQIARNQATRSILKDVFLQFKVNNACDWWLNSVALNTKSEKSVSSSHICSHNGASYRKGELSVLLNPWLTPGNLISSASCWTWLHVLNKALLARWPACSNRDISFSRRTRYCTRGWVVGYPWIEVKCWRYQFSRATMVPAASKGSSPLTNHVWTYVKAQIRIIQVISEMRFNPAIHTIVVCKVDWIVVLLAL